MDADSKVSHGSAGCGLSKKVALAKRALILCGGITVEWDSFMSTLEDWILKRSFRLPSGGHGFEYIPLADLLALRSQLRSYIGRETRELRVTMDSSILRGISMAKATNPKDKIFSLHEILKKLGVLLLTLTTREMLRRYIGETLFAIFLGTSA